MKSIYHSSGTMRVPNFLFLLAISGWTAFAQTNGADYSVPGLPAGATNANETAPVQESRANARRLSLQDCIQLALEHNLDLQIERYNPQLALFKLRGDYGAYEPALNLSGAHQYAKSGPRLFGTNSLPPLVTEADTFNAGVGGVNGGSALLPWGTAYRLDGTITDTEQSAGGLTVPNTQGSVQLTASQPLLKNFWIDSARLTIRVDKNRLKYSELELKLQIMTTITTLEKAYYDLIYDRENVVVQQKAVELAERLVEENKRKLQVGALAPLDLANAQAQAAQSRAAVIAAKSQLGTQERNLKQLITDQFSEWADIGLEPSGTLTAAYQFFDRQSSWSKGLTQRPELLQAKLDVERQGIQLKYDRNQLFPQLDVSGTYGYNGSGQFYSGALYDIQQRNRPTYSFGGSISIPLANLAARNAYKADKATLQQLLLTLKKQEQTIMIAIDNDIGTLQADYDQVLATRAQREYEEQALDAEQKKLENGKSTTYTVLQVQRDLTAARGAEIQALDTYNKDLAQFSLDEGTTLERLKIDLEVK